MTDEDKEFFAKVTLAALFFAEVGIFIIIIGLLQ